MPTVPMESGIIACLAGSCVGDMCVVGGEAGGKTETAAEWSLVWSVHMVLFDGEVNRSRGEQS